MEDESKKLSQSGVAALRMIDAMNLSPRQLKVVAIMNDFVAMGATSGLAIGAASGLSAQEIMHAIKTALAALLAGYDADTGPASAERR